ncbi:hypothetical protein EVAR_22321_1 [Eumeta japonica]|uniref:Uncharacterized protein n=1 Tax=Eumeta variegata TaxID=151549 RepID=A0A4C1UAP7_EUMVA|nr:hypothetical protein EVAR_22321_1 [Eumeta japonica]
MGHVEKRTMNPGHRHTRWAAARTFSTGRYFFFRVSVAANPQKLATLWDPTRFPPPGAMVSGDSVRLRQYDTDGRTDGRTDGTGGRDGSFEASATSFVTSARRSQNTHPRECPV